MFVTITKYISWSLNKWSVFADDLLVPFNTMLYFAAQSWNCFRLTKHNSIIVVGTLDLASWLIYKMQQNLYLHVLPPVELGFNSTFLQLSVLSCPIHCLLCRSITLVPDVCFWGQGVIGLVLWSVMSKYATVTIYLTINLNHRDEQCLVCNLWFSLYLGRGQWPHIKLGNVK